MCVYIYVYTCMVVCVCWGVCWWFCSSKVCGFVQINHSAILLLPYQIPLIKYTCMYKQYAILRQNQYLGEHRSYELPIIICWIMWLKDISATVTFLYLYLNIPNSAMSPCEIFGSYLLRLLSTRSTFKSTSICLSICISFWWFQGEIYLQSYLHVFLLRLSSEERWQQEHQTTMNVYSLESRHVFP